ncbi:hypothetical protein HYFRA_00008012 [Hymenoscyphus fraxineus]|uniref:Small secreted protein n=1 Tax=Hymenoscyphus fraxineus TaxID=746836 RepID=A0A9N9PQ76_9HELO|nr:hypothetical protein HYFRA_00008012 [Hymenoscyphus fraxineus]
MQFSAALVMAFATLSIAAPLSTRALGTKTYNELSISGGTAGDGEAEALAKLDVGSDFAAVSKEDIKFLNDVNDLGNAAEKEGFNPLIESATGDEKIAAANGKTKNKILKLMASVLELKAEGAQGKDTTAKLAEEQKKLDGNIAKDKANAGQPSTAVEFEGTAGGEAGGVKKEAKAKGKEAKTKSKEAKDTKA